MKTHYLEIDGDDYAVRKMRTPDSFHLPLYHVCQGMHWMTLNADTLAEARQEIKADLVRRGFRHSD